MHELFVYTCTSLERPYAYLKSLTQTSQVYTFPKSMNIWEHRILLMFV